MKKEKTKRLIDVDVLKESAIKRWDEREEEYGGYYDTGCEFGKKDDIEWIEEQPIVDAIPVEQIEKWIVWATRSNRDLFAAMLQFVLDYWRDIKESNNETDRR